MKLFGRFRLAAVVALGWVLGASVLAQKPAVAKKAGAMSWTMQESGTTAGLRGIYSVDGKVAWASGAGGTVLRTVDGGEHWAKCAVPDGDKDGETLDFRGVQAWDAKKAVVMASGLGEKSRLYMTMDGCTSWNEIVRNRDKDGFWDGATKAYLDDGTHLLLLGDPVGGCFYLRRVNMNTGPNSTDLPLRLFAEAHVEDSLKAPGNAGAFAASNSLIVVGGGAGSNLFIAFGTGGNSGAAVYRSHMLPRFKEEIRWSPWLRIPVPISGSNASSGIFSIASGPKSSTRTASIVVAVGGDYAKPNESAGTAAFSKNGGKSWTASTKTPHGFRSAVTWSEDLKAWITVGTNGSDVSRDDGKTWEPFDDGNWNALSLPFVVGPKGRIGRLVVGGK